MTAIVKSPQYLGDVTAIWTHIALDSEEAADRVVTAIESTIELLAEFPRMGTPCPHLAPGLRRAMWRRYLIYYRDRPDVAEIVRVLHGSRNITDKLFRNRRA